MKKILCLFFVGLCSSVHAQMVPFDYTGDRAQIIDGTWMPSNLLAFGGPANDDLSASGQQFTLSSPLSVSAIDMTAFISAYSPGSISVTYDLYGQSTFDTGGLHFHTLVPDPSSLLLQSDPIDFTETEDQYEHAITQTVKEQVPFNINLQPGTYWIAEQGEGGPLLTTEQALVDPVAVPEPPLLWLVPLCIGLFKRNAGYFKVA